jgi:hypothetical protein
MHSDEHPPPPPGLTPNFEPLPSLLFAEDFDLLYAGMSKHFECARRSEELDVLVLYELHVS